MITLKQFLEAIQYKITEGSEYLWKCYGESAYSIDYWNGKFDDSVSASCIFDTKTQQVYEVQGWDEKAGVEYRWINPDYIKQVKKEFKAKKIDFTQSIDERKFTDLDVEDDILAKITGMVAGIEYDKRIVVPLDLTEDEEYTLMKMAHKADMSLNKFVEYILTEEITRRQANNVD